MNIKEIRKAKHITQQQLADAINVDFSMISKYENGKVTPPINRIGDIAKVLGVDVDTLLNTPSDIPAFEARRMSITSLDEDRFYVSSSSIADTVLKNANGICELCGYKAPNITNGQEFLETHFIVWLSKGGHNEPHNIVALCPNCHKLIHMQNNPKTISKLLQIASKHNVEY